MKFHIKPSTLSGTLQIPPSKSHTQRAILFALLAEGKSTIQGYLQSPDTLAMVEAVKTLGAEVEMTPDRIEIRGVGPELTAATDVIDAGNSGQVLRFIGGLAALIPTYTVITGDHSIRHNRPITPLLSALSQLGVFAESMQQNGRAPIIIKGPMVGGRVELDGGDSQAVSGLIIASCFAKNPTEIHVVNPGEKPWIDLTLHWLDFLGMPYENHDYRRYLIPGQNRYKGFEITPPGDLSSMAFPLAAALITNSSLTLKNVDMNDVQGDKKIALLLTRMGADITIESGAIQIAKGEPLRGARLDINDTIDAIAILAVIGCFSKGETVLFNAATARGKESDRIHAITTELKKMGADIEERRAGLIIRPSQLKGADLESYGDHRIALALSVAALGAEGESTLSGAECISKTYPTFARDMQEVGANIKVES
ncbi:MAG: 3-phosphoshikimate 1-carboxyvinyltransferase [Chlamydiae bacterium]|nr:3-phosphoshikimate 1-carboxyvinyltransferase [Chlamydiota bacterium]